MERSADQNQAFFLWRALPAWLRGLIRTMRPKQWVKNGFVFIPILFDRKLSLNNPQPLINVLITFVLFCMMSSAVYVLNDLVDVERDRKHPTKRFRPIASGQLPIPVARVVAIALPVITLGIALFFNLPLFIVLAIYYAKDLAYSFYLKNVVILDVLLLASGFILRVVAGAVVIVVTNFSAWLYICWGMLALFLAVGKRRQEMILMGSDAGQTRKILSEYNMELLNDMLRMVMTGSILSYALYSVEAKTSFGGPAMILTLPFVIYGVFRYLYLIHVKGEGSAPDELLFKDRPLLITVILFVLMTGIIIYIAPIIQRTFQ
ncbi:MAG: decaprenyl-phosphate phosphoribosyltransferase [Anaerolineae bacterium]|nr:decaprenyl-phosphate phosphoribosyltransferase [Anaerolineae bacterium]